MTDGQTDRRTVGQNYDSQDRASIAASRGKCRSNMIDAPAIINKLVFKMDMSEPTR